MSELTHAEMFGDPCRFCHRPQAEHPGGVYCPLPIPEEDTMPDEKITVETQLTTTEWAEKFREATNTVSDVLLKVAEATSTALDTMRKTIEMLGEAKIGERISAVLDQERLAASIKHDRKTIDAAIENFELETGMDYPESGIIVFTGPDDTLLRGGE